MGQKTEYFNKVKKWYEELIVVDELKQQALFLKDTSAEDLTLALES